MLLERLEALLDPLEHLAMRLVLRRIVPRRRCRYADNAEVMIGRRRWTRRRRSQNMTKTAMNLD